MTVNSAFTDSFPPGRQLPGPSASASAPVRANALAWLLPTIGPRLRKPLRIELPGQTPIDTGKLAEQTHLPTLRVHDRALFSRIARDGKLGLGESYQAGEWDADDLPDVLVALANAADMIPAPLWRVGRRLGTRRREHQPNTVRGATRNIRHHYDLSNELFALFLDESMTYSSAVFAPGDTLKQAQARKRALLLDDLDVGPGQHLLEIGTGWGALALDAARRGCRVTTVTLSLEQAFATQRLIADAGLQDRVEVLVRDYRNIEGRYDAIVSVEMLEAVGSAWWPTYFARISDLLSAGGRASIQTITMTHEGWRAARGGYGWIHRYIFPGGEIPSLPALATPVTEAGLQLVGRRDIGDSYVKTLQAWRDRFRRALPEVSTLGFDTTFERTWDFYLAYCEAGFRTGRIGVSQLLLSHSATPASCRRDWKDAE